ncbi:stage II sporulation protein M [Rhodobium gokarnense]|uniref:Membrane protein SpoIIM required for sporulation n=1 Tax=Rhodobium gokarnense TaxID=364296 RepID=A0ABT3HG80_9HYPH|nr:stage II sporulation protein M [Rhodobium gokarnense]MCW2309416.1 putative membrane protein SpoIIM required for sporulation [Rhodobium gokarnense]
MDQGQLMRSARFRKEREADWKRLERLVTEAETHGIQHMSFAAARDLSALYRQATTALAIAREVSLDKALLEYLEALTARAYLSVYAPQERVGGVLRRFFAQSAPRAMRRSWPFILAAYLCLGLGVFVGYLLYQESTGWYHVFMPSGLAGGRGPEATTEFLRRALYDEAPDKSALGAFATFLFSHNTQVAFLVFGLGVFLCVPAILLTVQNGLSLGAFFALYVDRGLGVDLAAWLSVHGVTELSAICVACAGGLQLGWAVLFPGDRTRRDALRHAGRDAAKLAIVAAAMLLVAAVLEGFARQLIQQPETRFALGWGVGLLWLAWVVLAGRSPR